MTTIPVPRVLGAAVLLGILATSQPAPAAPLDCAPAGVSCERAAIGFSPAYPAGGQYDGLIGPLRGTFVLDGDADGSFADERCDTNREAQMAEARSVIGTLVALGTVCEALPSGPNVVCAVPPLAPVPGPQEFCSAALIAPAVALEVNAIFITSCELQDGFVDAAEAEATYENTKLLLARDLEERLKRCDRLVGLFLPRQVGGRLEEVRDLVALRIRQYEQAAANSPADFSRELANAHKRFDAAQKWWAEENHKEAYRNYCAAYRELRGIRL
jgi:hypothetical protein